MGGAGDKGGGRCAVTGLHVAEGHYWAAVHSELVGEATLLASPPFLGYRVTKSVMHVTRPGCATSMREIHRPIVERKRNEYPRLSGIYRAYRRRVWQHVSRSPSICSLDLSQRRLAGVETGRELVAGLESTSGICGWLWGKGTPSCGNMRTDTYGPGIELGSGARKEH